MNWKILGIVAAILVVLAVGYTATAHIIWGSPNQGMMSYGMGSANYQPNYPNNNSQDNNQPQTDYIPYNYYGGGNYGCPMMGSMGR